MSNRICDDGWMWAYDIKGCYTVKSGYKRLISSRVPQPTATGINWLQIWNMNIPPKIGNFMWRSLSNCLPTMKSLQRRRVDVHEWCPVCHHESEDELHALVTCPVARNVWCLSAIGSFIGTTSSFRQWWIHLASNGSVENMEIAAVILWSIWLNR